MRPLLPRRHLLVGTALAAGHGLPLCAAALRGAARSVTIPTHEWAGELEERLDFPADWDVQVHEMRGAHASRLSETELSTRLANPLGARPLRELAAGKRRVVITFDDLTRPTPASAVTPWILRELAAAGVAEDNILFLAAFGTHRAMTQAEVQLKLGHRAANGFAWTNHNVFENHKELGVTRFGNHIKLNQTFLAADLKICISGVKAHEQAGVSGGAKAVLPGVASLDTIEYNHQRILPGTKTAGTFKVFKNEMRLDMIEAARRAGVDFTVQLLIDSRRRPVAAYAGDLVEAHHAAARFAANHYATPPAGHPDVIVANAYPVNNQAFRARWWIDRSLAPGGTGVLIIQHPLGLDPIHWLSARAAGRNGATAFDMLEKPRPASAPTGAALIVYSQYLTRNLKDNFPRETLFASDWNEVVKLLRARHKAPARVAVYPYAGLQEEPLPLDE